MKSNQEPDREDESPGEAGNQVSRLGAAILRINESLEVATVMREVVEAVCTLTSARYGAIATVDRAGEVQDFVSTGLTQDEHRRLVQWPAGPPLFRHLRDLAAPLRIADMAGYVRELGFDSEVLPSRYLMGMALSRHGEHVGNFYVGERKGGGEFSVEDEEVMILFASQAAVAIANARTYREEQRARTDLEALVDTSPVGVMVLDTRTRAPLKFNQEAKRIVRPLRTPGQSEEQMLDVLTCRLTDGREMALWELVPSRDSTSAETMRAEEIELRVPDGRRVATLVNATPIRSAEGSVETLFITLQDLAQLEELERQRAEFLDMVSHELRAPLSSIYGSATTLLEASSELDRAEIREFSRVITEQAKHMRGLISDLLDAGFVDSGTLSVASEPTEVAALVDRARNTFLSGNNGHNVLIDLAPGLPRVMADRRRIVQVLVNLLSNAARHCPGTLPIRVAAVREGAYIEISVRDEGRGIAPEQLARLFRKHARTDGSGGIANGLGLAICKGLVEAHGGRIWAKSAGPGQGARFSFTVPVVDGAVTGGAEDGRQGGKQAHVLVIDDDPRMLRYVRNALTEAGYTARVTGDFRELPQLIRAEEPDLVVLDLIFPDTDGIQLMHGVPELLSQPVIFISGYGRGETIAQALKVGAADYIVKPFSATELVARIGTALRGLSNPDPFDLGELKIRYDERQVTMAGRTLELTFTEYELLRVLSLNAGRVSTYDSLLRQVWKGRKYADAKLVRAYVRRLRVKLGDNAKSPTYILNERGVGYRMARAGDLQ